jgi:hypothetical protein
LKTILLKILVVRATLLEELLRFARSIHPGRREPAVVLSRLGRTGNNKESEEATGYAQGLMVSTGNFHEATVSVGEIEL